MPDARQRLAARAQAHRRGRASHARPRRAIRPARRAHRARSRIAAAVLGALSGAPDLGGGLSRPARAHGRVPRAVRARTPSRARQSRRSAAGAGLSGSHRPDHPRRHDSWSPKWKTTLVDLTRLSRRATPSIATTAKSQPRTWPCRARRRPGRRWSSDQQDVDALLSDLGM